MEEGGGPDYRNLLYSPSELLAPGSGHHPDPQVLIQDRAVICSLSELLQLARQRLNTGGAVG